MVSLVEVSWSFFDYAWDQIVTQYNTTFTEMANIFHENYGIIPTVECIALLRSKLRPLTTKPLESFFIVVEQVLVNSSLLMSRDPLILHLAFEIVLRTSEQKPRTGTREKLRKE